MSMRTSAGLQDSGTTGESTAENVEADLDLADMIEQHGNTDWSEILGMSAAEAGARTARLIEAQDVVRKGLGCSVEPSSVRQPRSLDYHRWQVQKHQLQARSSKTGA